MTSEQFLEGLIASYPPNIRPDAEYVRQISDYLRRKHYSSQELEEAYEIIRTSFRMFPSLADIQTCFVSAANHIHASSSSEVAYDYFRLDGVGYRRKLHIDGCGNVMRRPIPEGAEEYHLVVPDRMRNDKDFLTAEQAVEQGYLPKGTAIALRMAGENHMKERFKKIKQEMKKAEFGAPPPPPHDDGADIDDSMAANPEDFDLEEWNDL